MRLSVALGFLVSLAVGLNFRRGSPRVCRRSVVEVEKADALAPDRKTNPRSGLYDFEQWAKAFETQSNEFDYVVEMEEVVPTDFTEGTLFRAMPALFEGRDGVPYGHYLDGDGYIIKLSIGKEQVRFQSKFVRTEEFEAEEKSGKILMRSTFRTQRAPNKWSTELFGVDFSNALDLELKNLANTNVVYWADKLLVLFEAGIPYRLDPRSLDTLGMDDLGVPEKLNCGLPVLVPKLKEQASFIHDAFFGQHCTAHPKFDPASDSMVLWTWCAGTELDGIKSTGPLDSKPIIHFREFDRQMNRIKRIKKEEKKEKGEEGGDEAEGDFHSRAALESSLSDESTQAIVLKDTSVAPHDFSITPNHYCIVENRLGGDTLPYILGTKCPAECVNINSEEKMQLHLVPRIIEKGESPAKRWVIPLESGFTIHSVAAWEKGAHVELLTSAWACEDVASGAAKGGLLGNWEGRAPNFEEIPITLLYHTIVNKETGALVRHAPVDGMESVIIEHPHINPSVEGQPVRYVYMSLGSQTGVSSPPLGYLRVDMETGERQEWYAPEHTFCEEVVVVPKEGGKDEDDVYLLAAMFDAELNRSCIGIIDGKAVHKGPVCRMWLKHQLPHSLHGCFTPQLF